MSVKFTGEEPWLKIPVDDLKMSDLPTDYWPSLIVLALREMEYEEYLKTEHWHTGRLLAIKRYRGNACARRMPWTRTTSGTIVADLSFQRPWWPCAGHATPSGTKRGGYRPRRA